MSRNEHLLPSCVFFVFLSGVLFGVGVALFFVGFFSYGFDMVFPDDLWNPLTNYSWNRLR